MYYYEQFLKALPVHNNDLLVSVLEQLAVSSSEWHWLESSVLLYMMVKKIKTKSKTQSNDLNNMSRYKNTTDNASHITIVIWQKLTGSSHNSS